MKLPTPKTKHAATLYHLLINKRMTSVEEWKDIPGFEGRYQASNLGNIRSLDRVDETKRGLIKYRGQNLSVCRLKKYCMVSLGRKRRRYVHRFVAEAFIPNPQNKPQVNHIDGNKHNNKVENLEWCTASENELHSRRVLGKKNGKRPLGVKKKNPKKILCIDDGKVFQCREDAAEYYSTTPGAITNAANGTRSSLYGFRFTYFNQTA